MVSLDSLSVYWNSRTQLYGQLPQEERERRFISEIATSEATPPAAKYSEQSRTAPLNPLMPNTAFENKTRTFRLLI